MPPLKNEVGNKYGRLTVLERSPQKGAPVRWICRCDCGNITTVAGTSLRNGHTQSCGCLGKEKLEEGRHGKKINEIGNRYGKLVVIGESEKHKGKEYYWICKCDCGETTTVRGTDLRSGKTKSCGCLRYSQEDLTGQKFGRLTVVSYSHIDDKYNIYWNCACDCGNQIAVRAASLKNGSSQSCGCMRIEKLSKIGKDKLLDITNQRFGQLRVIGRDTTQEIQGNTKWICKCDCGNTISVFGNNLKRGHTRSCGCMTASWGVIQIEKILTENNIQYIKEYSVKIEGSLFRFDFFVQNSYFIEFDGSQHFQSKGSGWNIRDNTLKTHEHDLKKNQYCFLNKIPLIRIPYAHDSDIIIQDLIPETSSFLITQLNEQSYYDKYYIEK